MALTSEVTAVLNEQINKEMYSAYLYLTFADYYEDRGLKGFANWYLPARQRLPAHDGGHRQARQDL